MQQVENEKVHISSAQHDVAIEKKNFYIVLPALILYVIGLLMIYDSSSGEIVDLAMKQNEFGPFFKQLIWGGASATIAWLFHHIGWRYLITHSYVLYIILTVLLLFVFFPGIGISANGAHRWISFFGFSIQPSEFVKIFLPAFYLRYLDQQGEKIYNSFLAFFRFMLLIGIPVGLIAIEPNNGTAGVIGLSIAVLLAVTRIPTRFWLVPTVIAACILCVFAISSPYVRSRIDAYKNPEADIRGKGHQPYQAKIAAGSGGIFGRGPAKSRQKLSYLPEAQNDYIAAIYAEEFGFLGICGLIGIYGFLILRLTYTVFYTSDSAAFSWGIVLIFLLSLQTFMNLGVVSGLLPSTGLNLPFFSQGGSSLMANFTALGIVTSMKDSEKTRKMNKDTAV